MKKSLVLVSLACCAFFGVSRAGIVSVNDAQTVAVNFFKLNAGTGHDNASISATLIYTRTESDNSIDYYVFNISPTKGFVIVAADDNIKPVIAYSTESNFNSNLTKTGVVDWMNHAALHIRQIRQLNVPANGRISGLWAAYRAGTDPITNKSTVVTPLLKTTWNQEPGYNAFCPFNTTDNQRCLTGCVATAMAQIMKFWNFPPKGNGSNSYDAYNYQYNVDYGTQSANFGTTNYNWAGMLNEIGSNDTAIATLMYQCGVSVDMDYGDDIEDGSGAFVLSSDIGGSGPCSQNSYANYFSYNPNTMQGLYESNYDSSGWLTALETELNAGRPLQYEASSSAGGHTWVCDGYDNNNLVHMNWGWGGVDDGYFAVSDLDAGGYLFNADEAVLIGIEPIEASVQINANTLHLCSGDTASLQAVANATTYSWTPTTGLTCPTCANTMAVPATTTTYTVVIDSSGVQGLAFVTVEVRRGPTVSNGDVNNATCNGLNNGSAAVSASGVCRVILIYGATVLQRHWIPTWRPGFIM